MVHIISNLKKTLLVTLLVLSLLLCGCDTITDEPPLDIQRQQKLFLSTLEYFVSGNITRCAILTMQIATTDKIPVDFLWQIKLGVMNPYSDEDQMRRYIYADGFKISTPLRSNVEDKTSEVYYRFDQEPYRVSSNETDITTQGNYTELLTFQLYDLTPRTGEITVKIEPVVHLPGTYNCEIIRAHFATDGEYIAFSLESKEAAQAMLEK